MIYYDVLMDEDLKNLQTIPGVGKIIAKDFWSIGIKQVSGFRGKNPEDLYFKICEKRGFPVDRCMLYVCRLAVYFAETKNHDPAKSKWWFWKDDV